MSGSTGTAGVIVAAIITAGGAIAAAWVERSRDVPEAAAEAPAQAAGAQAADGQAGLAGQDAPATDSAAGTPAVAPTPPAELAAPAAGETTASVPATSDDGRNRTLAVVNASTRPIWRIKATRKGVRDFGTHDWLGKAAIPVGQSARVTFDDGSSACLFDMRFEFATGEPVNRMAVDVCRESEVRVSDG